MRSTIRNGDHFHVDPLAADLLSIALIAAMVVGLVAASGNLTTGPRIIDDNQIFSLSHQAASQGFRITLAEQLRTRAEMGRLIPVFLAEKVLKARVYGDRLGLWKAHLVALGVLAGAVFYLFLSRAGFTRLESLAFSLLIVIGPQSVLWIRLIHGEGVGLLLFALALGCLLGAVRNDRWRPLLDLAFVGFAGAAALSKESFLLTVPALLLWRLVLMRELRGWSARTALGRSLGVLSATALFGLAAVTGSLLLKAHFQKWYVGYERLEAARLAEASAELLTATAAWWIVPALAGCLAVTVAACRPQPGLARRMGRLGGYLAVAVVLVAPQVVLYSKLGFASPRHVDLTVSRYLVPAACGTALAAVALARAVREAVAAGGLADPLRRLARAVPLLLLALLAADRAWAAYGRAEIFARRTAMQNHLMEYVRWNTRSEDPIVVVYDGQRARIYNRYEAIMEHYLQRPRVLRFPVASSRPLREEKDRRIRARTGEKLRVYGRAPGAIVIEESPAGVHEAFQHEAADWFRPECHRHRTFWRQREVYVPTRCGAAGAASEGLPGEAE